MKTKEKAQELYNKYFSMITIESPIDRVSSIPYVKKCALIAVDEILKAVDNPDETYLMKHLVEYWSQVKQEIENL
jgi:hypothetical protein